jgi:hypothetical protein
MMWMPSDELSREAEGDSESDTVTVTCCSESGPAVHSAFLTCWEKSEIQSGASIHFLFTQVQLFF